MILLNSFINMGKVSVKMLGEKKQKNFCTQNDFKCIREIPIEKKAQW